MQLRWCYVHPGGTYRVYEFTKIGVLLFARQRTYLLSHNIFLS